MKKAEMFNIQAVDWQMIGPNRTAIFQGAENVTIQYWELPPGSSSKNFPHSHPYEQISCVLAGNCIFGVDGEEFEAGPGCMVYMPANAMHYGITVGSQTAVCIDVFAPKREDRPQSPKLCANG